VKKFVKSCDVCVLANNPHHRLHGFLQPLPISTSPWFSISMDFITNLPPSSSNDSILVVVDYLMKMVHFIMCIKTIIAKEWLSYFLIMFFNIMVFIKISFMIIVTTLALSSRPRQGFVKVQGKCET